MINPHYQRAEAASQRIRLAHRRMFQSLLKAHQQGLNNEPIANLLEETARACERAADWAEYQLKHNKKPTA
jgi:hypothetical protein